MGNYIKTGNTVNVSAEGAMEVFKKLPTAIYAISIEPMQPIKLIEMESFRLPDKLYGDIPEMADRIINTFKDRPCNTGVLLDGLKGSGKTLLAKNIIIELLKQGVPAIIVDYTQICPDVVNFLELIDTEAVVLFDEIDKCDDIEEHNRTNCMLSLLDGLSNHKKLFILTSNEYSRINDYFKDRPGRIYYAISFTGLNHTFVEQYAEDNLVNKEHLKDLLMITDNIPNLSFDILAAFIEETNRYNKSPKAALKYLNISVDFAKRCVYTVYDSEGSTVNIKYPDEFVWVNIASDDGYYIYYIDKDLSEKAIHVNFADFKTYSRNKIEYEVGGYKVIFTTVQPKSFDKEALLKLVM